MVWSYRYNRYDGYNRYNRYNLHSGGGYLQNVVSHFDAIGQVSEAAKDGLVANTQQYLRSGVGFCLAIYAGW